MSVIVCNGYRIEVSKEFDCLLELAKYDNGKRTVVTEIPVNDERLLEVVLNKYAGSCDISGEAFELIKNEIRVS